jgi:hypothetical protein
MGGPGSGNRAYGFGYNRGHEAGLSEGRAQAGGIGAIVGTLGLIVGGVAVHFIGPLVSDAISKRRGAGEPTTPSGEAAES